MIDEAAMALSNAQNPSAVHAIIVPTMPIATDNGMGRIERPALVPRSELEAMEADYLLLASRLDGHDAKECRMNLDRLIEQRDRLADALSKCREDSVLEHQRMIDCGYVVAAEQCAENIRRADEALAAVKGGIHE